MSYIKGISDKQLLYILFDKEFPGFKNIGLQSNFKRENIKDLKNILSHKITSMDFQKISQIKYIIFNDHITG